ncbi:MAG: hypothetical protein H7301_07605 [Cryobacterium sp.]|nr:hypothetical protein [Oligoflexia bacterium]
MRANPKTANIEIVKGRKLLIAASDPMQRAYLLSLAVEMGFETRKTYMAKDRSEALHFTGFEGAHTILFDDSLGFPLLEELQEMISTESLENAFVFLLTENSSQAGIGRAVESEVDGFALKPFAADEFKATFLEKLTAKIIPSEFNRIIALGRARLYKGDFDQAEVLFEKAKNLDSAPSNAHFYAGQAKLMRKLMGESKNEFKLGLAQNSIHCKCLKAMYELLVHQGKTLESYEVLRRLVGIFPDNSARLHSAIKLAVKTANFSDVANWFEIYEGQIEKTEEVKIAIGAGLAVLGRYYLIHEEHEQAVKMFERAILLGVKKSTFLTYAVDSMQKYGLNAESARFLEIYSRGSVPQTLLESV